MEIEHNICVHVRTLEEDEAVINLLQKFNIEMIWNSWNNWKLPYGKTFFVPEKKTKKFEQFLDQLKKL